MTVTVRSIYTIQNKGRRRTEILRIDRLHWRKHFTMKNIFCGKLSILITISEALVSGQIEAC